MSPADHDDTSRAPMQPQASGSSEVTGSGDQTLTSMEGGARPRERHVVATLPDRLGRYRVEARLGQGAMGVVYRAFDPLHERFVAVKTIQGMSPEAMYRLKREFRSLATFDHPNVVSLHELAVDGDHMFFSMELLVGVDFVTWLCGPRKPAGDHGPCRDYDRLVSAFQQLCSGVCAIHRAGLLHRDLKPSNVLVTDDGRVVILDFGLVYDHRANIDRSLTQSGVVMGTPLYMSPEQAVGDAVGPASDWYCVGEMLYETLTGRPPFRRMAMLALLAAKQEETPPPPSSRCEGIPPELDQLCVDLLQRDPAARPRGEEVLRRLGGLAIPTPARASESSPFLGRQTELGDLHRAFASSSERPVLALVEGVSGIGKTALIERFLADLRSNNAVVVLQGRCSEREAIPYKGLDSVMDELSLHLKGFTDPADVWALLPRDIRSLARLFPVLLTVPAIANAPARHDERADPAEVRRRAFAALTELFGRISDRQRLVVWIDDLQWSDRDSLALLQAVIGSTDAPSMLTVASFRQGPDPRGQRGRLGSGLADFVDALQEDDAVLVHRIPVGPMQEHDAIRLANALLGGQARIRRDWAEEVAREAEGSPFFVGELVRYVQRQTDARTDDLVDSDSAVSLDNVIRHRLRRLPDEARRLLEVLAVAGGKLTSKVAFEVATPDGTGFAALQQLRAEHLVRPHGPTDGAALEIYHDRIRETALRELDTSRLPALHLALGRALAASGDADEVALSHHFRQAGEDQLAILHTLAAADQAGSALAFDRAAQLYRAALELDTLRGEELAEVEAKLGQALAHSGELYDSAQAYLRAAEATARRELGLEWTRLAAEHLLSSGYSDEGRVVLARVLGMVGLKLPTSDGQAIASLAKERIALRFRSYDVPTRPESECSPLDLQRADVCFTAARGLLYTDGLLGADFHARGLRWALRCAEPLRLSRAIALEAHVTLALGADPKLPKASALFDRAAALAEQADSHYARAMVHECAGNGFIGIGDFARAFEELERACAIFSEHCTGVGHEIGYCRAHAAICLLLMGRVQELTPRAIALLREGRERANPYVEGFARGLLGNIVLLAPDRVDEAAEQLAAYRRDAPRRFQAHMLNYVCQSSALERYRGRPAEAWAQAERDRPIVERLVMLRAPHPRAEMLLWRGQSALAGASALPPDSDRELLRIVDDTAADLLRHQSGFARGYGLLIRAGAAGLRGRTEAVVRSLRAAIEIFDQRSMASFAAAGRLRLAAAIGGDEGTELEADARAYLQREGILRHDRFLDMVTPGFERR